MGALGADRLQVAEPHLRVARLAPEEGVAARVGVRVEDGLADRLRERRAVVLQDDVEDVQHRARTAHRRALGLRGVDRIELAERVALDGLNRAHQPRRLEEEVEWIVVVDAAERVEDLVAVVRPRRGRGALGEARGQLRLQSAQGSAPPIGIDDARVERDVVLVDGRVRKQAEWAIVHEHSARPPAHAAPWPTDHCIGCARHGSHPGFRCIDIGWKGRRAGDFEGGICVHLRRMIRCPICCRRRRLSGQDRLLWLVQLSHRAARR